MDILKRRDILVTVFIIGLFLIIIELFLMPLIRKDTRLYQNKDGINEEQAYKRIDRPVFPYTLTHPSKKFKLPRCLDEISGLSYLEQNRLVCIQDEKGSMYVFDIEKEKVIERFKFGKGNDYEDIAIVKKSAYILQSNGTILRVKDFESDAPKVKKYNTLLSKKNDAEGLTFDEESNALLIACKDSPHLKEKRNVLKGKKVIYRFDLNTKEISEKPACIIDLDYLLDYLKDSVGNSSTTKSSIGLIRIFNPRKGDINFRPSGIAVHPKSKNIYIISSADRMLIVLSREGDIITAKRLIKKIFKQPEGICFNPEGDLFISNERNGSRANILMFNYQK